LNKNWYDHPYFAEHRERFQKGVERMEAETYAFLASLGYEHDAKTNSYVATRPNDDRIALFAHEGFGKMFLSTLLDIPYPMCSTRIDMSHSCVTVIEFPNHEGNRVFPRMLQLSNDSHLYREGLPTNYKNRIIF
jgi:probable phosphoglycerate mutase